ncbi:MAG TPA: hypothetical protein DCE56_30785 [Cyanobacteria bacterium UBA8553]|nr:hypothetical protein [Cyanobacteria bacterium UBA8553]HAJ62879.1 hypothetical protein [Cyanobacteria bacterium UBA8543]
MRLHHQRWALGLAVALLVGGYPIPKPVQANPPVQTAQSIWKPFSSTQGRFTVLMPGTPRHLTLSVNTQDAGIVNLNMFLVERNQESVIYGVGYNDYPISYIQQLNQKKLIEHALDLGRDAAIRGSQGSLQSERRISLGGYPGREIRYTRPGGKITITRMYLVKQRLYQVTVETTQQKQRYLSKSIEGFLNSFSLLSR